MKILFFLKNKRGGNEKTDKTAKRNTQKPDLAAEKNDITAISEKLELAKGKITGSLNSGSNESADFAAKDKTKGNKTVKMGNKARLKDKKARFVPKADHVRKKAEESPKSVGKSTEEKKSAIHGKKEKKKRVSAYFNLSLADCVTLEINGFNQTRLLKELSDGGVKISGIRRYGSNKMQIRIRKKQREKTFAICESMCYTYSVVSYDGLFAFFLGNIRRVGVVFGTVLCALGTFFLGGFVMKIDVNGLENIPKTEFLSYLDENGLDVGSRISALDRDEIRKIVNGFEGIAESGVLIKGTTVVINVVERDETSPRIELKPQVVSKYDARVTRIICASGTAKVKAGQIVKAGDTLIEGVIYDQNGESLDFPGAAGVVYGKVVYSRTFTVTADAYVYRRTGDKKTVTAFSIVGLKLGKNKSPYASYESVTTLRTLNGFIPLQVEQTVYYETEAVKETRSVEEITQSCVDEALMEFTGPDENMIYKTHVEELCPGTYNVSVYIEAETLISD